MEKEKEKKREARNSQWVSLMKKKEEDKTTQNGELGGTRASTAAL